MSVGLVVTKQEIDTRAGDIARAAQHLVQDIATMQGFYQEKTDQDLIDLGYTAQEAAVQKSAFANLYHWSQIFAGVDVQATPYDFRTFVRQLWGVGAF